MKQLTKNKSDKKKRKKNSIQTQKKHSFGTSKLEVDFAKEFLDKLGVKYIYQFEAKDIGRYYDYAIILNNEMTTGNMLLIEIDGSYFHSDPRLVSEDKMSPMQKKNKRVDELKNRWAMLHGIPLIRIWEKDIRERPKVVMEELMKRLYIEREKVGNLKKMNQRHVNKFK